MARLTEDELAARIGNGACERVAETIGEMMWDGRTESGPTEEEGQDGHVYLSDVQEIDACNHMASGSFWWGGTEYSFLVENGNWAGFVFRSLSDTTPIPDVEIRRTVWAIAPANWMQCTGENADFMLRKWAALKGRADVKDLIGSFTYDRRVQPGEAINRHYRDKAAKLGAILVSEEEASDIWATLKRLAQHPTDAADAGSAES